MSNEIETIEEMKFRPVQYLDERNKIKGIAMVPRNAVYGYEPEREEHRMLREVGCFDNEFSARRAEGIPEIPIRIGTEGIPVLRYTMFRPHSPSGGFGEAVARIPWHWENYHVPGICSVYHKAITCDNLKDYRFQIERGGYEEREATRCDAPFVATHACGFCEWRGVLPETIPNQDGDSAGCPFCWDKKRRFSEVYEVEDEAESDGEDPVESAPEAAVPFRMSLHDYFAAAALISLPHGNGLIIPDERARNAWEIADAMMQERKKR